VPGPVSASPSRHWFRSDYSSTTIRQALSEGRPQDAARILGHWHWIEGKVLHGDKRGREIGFPTINLSMDGLHMPRFGIYAVLVDVISGPLAGRYQGAASIGVRPTFGVNAPNLEVFLFDFAGDLYDCNVAVALVAWLRPELKFDSVEALVTRMRQDCTEAAAILAEI
jgi:riboflavin kinase / FMN adenylyltransferase